MSYNPLSIPFSQQQFSKLKTNVLPFLIPRRSYVTKDAKEIHFNLADVGEGIAECEILKWYVEEGKEIQQFDMICEVQSDKATAEITSPYDGRVTKIYYDIGEMAKVGKPLIDIKVDDVENEEDIVSPEEKEQSDDSSTISQDSNDHDNQHYQELNTKSGPIKVGLLFYFFFFFYLNFFFLGSCCSCCSQNCKRTQSEPKRGCRNRERRKNFKGRCFSLS